MRIRRRMITIRAIIPPPMYILYLLIPDQGRGDRGRALPGTPAPARAQSWCTHLRAEPNPTMTSFRTCAAGRRPGAPHTRRGSTAGTSDGHVHRVLDPAAARDRRPGLRRPVVVRLADGPPSAEARYGPRHSARANSCSVTAPAEHVRGLRRMSSGKKT